MTRIALGKPVPSADLDQLQDGKIHEIINMYYDVDGTLRCRPAFSRDATGLTRIISSHEPFYSLDKDRYYSLLSNNAGSLIVVRIGSDYISTTLNYDSSIDTLSNTAIWDEDTTYVFCAVGVQVIKIDKSTGVASYVTDGPNHVTSLCVKDGYLLCNGLMDGGVVGDVNYTGPYTLGTYLTTWEVFNNEQLPDGCSAVAKDSQFIYAFGPSSVELSFNDGSTPWAAYGTGLVSYGLAAAESLVKLDNSFIFLARADNQLRVVRLSGNVITAISSPYDAILQTIDISDVKSHVITYRGQTFYLLSFLNSEYTLVYHMQAECWYRWTSFDPVSAQHLSLRIRHAFYDIKHQQTLISPLIFSAIEGVSIYATDNRAPSMEYCIGLCEDGKDYTGLIGDYSGGG
jgi:hypothetical protein